MDIPQYFQVGGVLSMAILSCFKCQSSKIIHRVLDRAICNHKINKPVIAHIQHTSKAEQKGWVHVSRLNTNSKNYSPGALYSQHKFNRSQVQLK